MIIIWPRACNVIGVSILLRRILHTSHITVFCGAQPENFRPQGLNLQASRPDRFMNFVAAAVSYRGVLPSVLAGTILQPTLTRVGSALWLVSLLTITTLSYYGSPAESVPSPECPVPSFDYRKSKCRKDINTAASMRHHGQSQDI